MDDNMMFDYLVQMGAMKPEQDELKRKQAMVDLLRQKSMQPMEGQMIGKHYVAPGLAGAISQLGQGYFAAKGQQGVDSGMTDMNARQKAMLEALRKKKSGETSYGGGLGGGLDSMLYGSGGIGD
jgi:hypothetical protein